MKLARWHLWVVGVALVLLVDLWFRPDHRPGPTHHPDLEESRTSHDPTSPFPPAGFDLDCVSCPPRTPESAKRVPAGHEAREACKEFLRAAAEQGIPDADTSHLEDCRDTPLFHASTAEQVHALLAAGADPNIHGDYGHTPLYGHLHRVMILPTEDGASMVQALLDGGADPWMKTLDGKLPYEVARTMNMSGMIKVQGEKFIKAKMAEEGITEAQMFADRPGFAEAMEQMRRAPEIANITIVSLMEAMEDAKPDLMRNLQ